MNQTIMRIEQNEQVAPSIFQMVISPITKDLESTEQIEIKPGQFLYLRVSDGTAPLLRRPISINDYNPITNQITLIYRVMGEGTDLISNKKTGESIDILGPLGNGFSYNNMEQKHVVLIGGGIGIPPLYYLAKKLIEDGINITVLLGFQSEKDAILIEQFSSLGEVRVATIDGSMGIKGTVMDLINKNETWDTFYSCGPKGMLKAIQANWNDTLIEGFISLEEHMGCGIGACYGCIVKVQQSFDPSGFKKVCADGPVFPFREVIL